MRRVVSIVFIIVGVVLLSVATYDYMTTKVSTDQAISRAAEVVGDSKEIEKVEAFQPELGEPVGVLTIPKLDVSLPIIEGTEEEMLAKGVGHFTSTAWPSEGEQILLSGHRDTVFKNFGELEVGDVFIVELSYGTFEYEMRSHTIVDKDDTSIIREMGEEVLTLSTCYPFHLLGAAPERYVIYAEPI